MRRWIIHQVRAPRGGAHVILDPEEVVRDAELRAALGEQTKILRPSGWLALRRAWEEFGRGHDGGESALAVVVSAPNTRTGDDLPFDIAEAATVSRIRVQGGMATARTALKAMDDESSDAAVQRIQGGLTAEDAILTAATGLPAQPLADNPALQFRLSLRIRRRAVLADLAALAWDVVEDPLAYSLLEEPPDVERLQAAWRDWLISGSSSPWAAHFEDAAVEITELLRDGTLATVEFDPERAPAWTRLGLRSASAGEIVDTLLGDQPHPPHDLESWFRVAEWWGEIRAGLAREQPSVPERVAKAWSVWEELDTGFNAWLRESYGSQLFRSWLEGPRSVDKIKPFLQKRNEEVPHVLLIVLDGMAFAQWGQIRAAAGLQVMRAGATLAMLPTLTEVSRQAIAAGSLPNDFSESLGTTSKEPQRWADGNSEAAWARLTGTDLAEIDSVPFEKRLLGVVVTTTDKLLHSALLGDASLRSGLDTWLSTGFLRELVNRAHVAGHEIWVTSDHGNLEVQPTAAPREGVFVESAGTRVRRYDSQPLRDAALVTGASWNDIPGLPDELAERLLFAPGRTAWTSSRVSHGGLSLDEVIVPFVNVVPK